MRRRKKAAAQAIPDLTSELLPADIDELAAWGWVPPCDCHPFNGPDSNLDCNKCHWPLSLHVAQEDHRCWDDEWRAKVEVQGGYYTPTAKACPHCREVGPHAHVTTTDGVSYPLCLPKGDVILTPQDIGARKAAIKAARTPPPLHLGYGGGD